MSPVASVSRATRALQRAGLIAAAMLVLTVGAHAQSLTIALSSAVNTIDPTQAQPIGTDVSVASHIYTPLVERTVKGELRGVLAESWKAEDDSTWIFNLRSDVKFPGGEPLDARVVKWNIDRIRDPQTKSRNIAWFAPVTDVEVVSPTQIKIRTKGAYPSLPAQLAMLLLLQPEWVASHNPATEAYGSGPYAMKSFRAGDRIVLEAKPNYFRGKPAFDTVTFRMIPEASARVGGIKAGELDIAQDIPLEEIAPLQKAGFEAGWIESIRTLGIRINNRKPPFANNIPLRQAINHAIDKQAMIDGLLGGKGTISNCQVISSAYFGYNDQLKPYAYDPKKAQQLIKQSGLPTPINVELQVPLGRYFMASEIGQVVAEQLKEVGINATIREMEFSAWVQPYAAGDMAPLSFIGQNWPTLDADGLLTLYTSPNRTAYYDSPAYDAAVAKARNTTNPEERLKHYREATKIFCDDAPNIFLFSQPLTYVMSKRVKWNVRGDDWVLASDFAVK